VDRIRNGKSFTKRRVRAIQKGEAIFAGSMTAEKEEKGWEHQIDIDVNEIPKREELRSDWELRNKAMEQLHGKKKEKSPRKEQEIEKGATQNKD
jgi:Acyl-CoA thioesterase